MLQRSIIRLGLGICFIAFFVIACDESNKCTLDKCNRHGTCYSGRCSCDEGYAGDTCARCEEGFAGYPDCAQINCSSDEDCSGHGRCVDYACTCDPNYAGDQCDRCDLDHWGYPNCISNTCQFEQLCLGHGYCFNNQCVCDLGYAGRNCFRCAKGYSGHPDCKPDPCAVPNPCNDHGSCSQGVCHCYTGYYGSRCGQCNLKMQEQTTTLLTPEDGLKTTWLRPVFRWEDLCNETGYQIQIASDPEFGDIIYQADVAQDETAHKPPQDTLAWDQRYYWRVIGHDDRDESQSSVNIFETNAMQLSEKDVFEISLGYKIRIERIAEFKNPTMHGASYSIYKEQGDTLLHHELSYGSFLGYIGSSIENMDLQGIDAPFFWQIHGTYLSAEEFDFDQMTVRVIRHPTCRLLTQRCVDIYYDRGETNNPCNLFCSYEADKGGSTLSNEPTQEHPLKIYSHTPKGFEKFNHYLIESLDFCYKRLKDFLAIDPEPDEVHYKEDIYTSGGCGANWDDFNCHATQEELLYMQFIVDNSVDGHPTKREDLQAGLCPTELGHELTHIMTTGMPFFFSISSGGNGALFEGIAAYMELRINDFKQSINMWRKLTCEEDGYRITSSIDGASWFDSDSYPYANFKQCAIDNDPCWHELYRSGYCIWDYIETNYGMEAIRNIFNDMAKVRSKPGPVRTCITARGVERMCQGTVLGDFIVPHTDPSILQIMEERFGITDGMTGYLVPSWGWWYFYEDTAQTERSLLPSIQSVQQPHRHSYGSDYLWLTAPRPGLTDIFNSPLQ